MSFHLLFPMAGTLAHEGYKYPPFMGVGGETFIEAALRPFLAQQHSWQGTLAFACLRDQEDQFNVTKRMRELVSHPHQVVALAQSTSGPAVTAAFAIEQLKLSGRIVICDCDHSLDVSRLVEAIDEHPRAKAIAPVWPLQGEDLKAWSVCALDGEGRMTGAAEKRLPDGHGDFWGVIGCTYISDAQEFCGSVREHKLRYVSDYLSQQVQQGNEVYGIPVSHAEFFGDATRLRRARAGRHSFSGTVFCDLDGTLVEHEDTPSAQGLRVLPGSVDKLREWEQRGYHIVLTTARDPSQENALRELLDQAQIPYRQLLMGLPRGPRYVINDRKPSAILTPQAGAIELRRNQGVAHVNLPDAFPEVRRRFTGGSLAETLLVEDEEKLFVRKRVSKQHDLALGYAKLQAQFRTLERFSQLRPGLVPALYGEQEDSYEYYFDMEYLPRHALLSYQQPAQQMAGLTAAMDALRAAIYRTDATADVDPHAWMRRHMERKIWPKLSKNALLVHHDVMLAKAGIQEKANWDGLDPRFHGDDEVEDPIFMRESLASLETLTALVDYDEVVVDDVPYPGLRRLLERVVESARTLGPRRLCAVHGDLTLENILFAQDDVRLIDMDGADYVDARELDLGKTLQSLVTRYESWAHVDEPVATLPEPGCVRRNVDVPAPDAQVLEHALELWAQELELSPEQAYQRGMVYMALHCIRMVPFRLKKGADQAAYALTAAIVSLHRAFETL